MHVLLGLFCGIAGALITLWLLGTNGSLLRRALLAAGIAYTLYIVAVLPILYGG